MRRLKFSFLLLFVAAASFAQTASEIESDQVKRVGSHLSCQCGSCQENLNCNMSSGQCHFCKPARTKIYKMQRAGESDAGIIASFVKEYGEKIFRRDPNSSFWMVPYLSLLAGAGLLWVVLKKMRGSNRYRPLPLADPHWNTQIPCSQGIAMLSSGIRTDWNNHEVDPSLIIGALLGAAMVGFLVFIRTKDLPAPAPVSPFRHLDERKAAIYENLRDLQFEYRIDKISDDDYKATKLELQKELAKVLAEVDRVKTELGQSPSKPVTAAVPVAAAGKAQPVKNVCPSCGAKFDKALKFCGECGKPMETVQ